MKLKIKNIEYEFLIENGNIYNIIIENPSFLHHLLNIFDEKNEDEIFIYDNSLLKVEDNILYIHNFHSFENEINSRKNLNVHYQQIEKFNVTDDEKLQLSIISQDIDELINKISLKSNVQMQHNSQFSFKDLFILTNLKFCISTENNFLMQFIYYLKSITNFYNFKIVIFFNLFDLLSQNDIFLLQSELSYLNLAIINISGHKNYKKCTKTIIIDEDLCELC